MAGSSQHVLFLPIAKLYAESLEHIVCFHLNNLGNVSTKHKRTEMQDFKCITLVMPGVAWPEFAPRLSYFSSHERIHQNAKLTMVFTTGVL